jgi:hypothetical protein
VLLQFIGNFRQDVSYDDIHNHIVAQLADFGLEYSDAEQIGIDSLENALFHFLPTYEVELYHIIYKPQRIEATRRLLNADAPHKAPYRLALTSSWDRSHNTTGAGHYALLNTLLATPNQILAALRAGDFEEGRFAMRACIHCQAAPVFLYEQGAINRTFCNIHCQHAHYLH